MELNTNREYDLYNDIKQRCKGEIYIGVVGPVRTGKSTFIKRFMEEMVLPNMSDEFEKERAVDSFYQGGRDRDQKGHSGSFHDWNCRDL